MTRIRTVILGAPDGQQGDSTQGLVEELAATLSVLRNDGGRTARVLVAIGSQHVQRRRLHGLPRVSSSVLRDMVGHQASRFFRLSHGGVVTAAAWIQRRGPAPEAVAVAVDRNLVAAVMQACAAESVELIDITPDAPELPRGLSLLPEEEQQSRRRRAWSNTLRLAKFTAVLWCAMIGVGVARERIAQGATAARLASLEEPATRVLEAKRVMDSVGAMLEAVARAKNRQRALAGMLSDLAFALPDSSVLSGVLLSPEGTGEISGLAVDPIGVVAGLQARHTGKVEFVAEPVVEPSAGREWSRFALRLGAGASR